ncbi:TetR family transcriptional regulator [Virgibacillus dakarensis]|uniref:TetR family transcriptional regulator n=1 Tax=Lentibacillus populi TaxID=1827502 RepID=A0A9W5U0H6_9BACI|nr:TetR family transcriptional regulator [Lentibacillus populi]MBT2218327.1 TetR/AcrR family transcriptional regulator [Virgibacillus dakarensis]MTW85675.1 TetR family transcriptional regulator [Virgibacillus dakarensis]GGB55636.1 TetR family transcriptional regulator [Lentibacillus populi]
MPKMTFYNLPEEKKQILIQAAKKEFSRVSLHEASISNIVKTAEIPRGSFYQYFSDKDDAFFYILDLYGKLRIREFVSSLKESNGDIFTTAVTMYQSTLRNCQSKENRDFFKNAFLNMNYKIERTFTDNFSQDKLTQLAEIRHLINTKRLNIADESDLLHIVQIIIAVAFHNLVISFARELSYDDAKKCFLKEINLLKQGLYKE